MPIKQTFKAPARYSLGTPSSRIRPDAQSFLDQKESDENSEKARTYRLFRLNVAKGPAYAKEAEYYKNLLTKQTGGPRTTSPYERPDYDGRPENFRDERTLGGKALKRQKDAYGTSIGIMNKSYNDISIDGHSDEFKYGARGEMSWQRFQPKGDIVNFRKAPTGVRQPAEEDEPLAVAREVEAPGTFKRGNMQESRIRARLRGREKIQKELEKRKATVVGTSGPQQMVRD